MDIKAIGFRVNVHDTCVANNMICNKQMTITWHVYDLKVYHDDRDIVGAFVKWTKETYGDDTKLKPSREKIHDHLAMTLDYTTSGKVKFCMKEYIDKIIE